MAPYDRSLTSYYLLGMICFYPGLTYAGSASRVWRRGGGQSAGRAATGWGEGGRAHVVLSAERQTHGRARQAHHQQRGACSTTDCGQNPRILDLATILDQNTYFVKIYVKSSFRKKKKP